MGKGTLYLLTVLTLLALVAGCAQEVTPPGDGQQEGNEDMNGDDMNGEDAMNGGQDGENGQEPPENPMLEGRCPDERPDVCTAVYDPVCAELADGNEATYANDCVACRDPDVIGFERGACDPTGTGLQEATITNMELTPSPIEEIWCDLDDRTLRFTLRNTDAKAWDLNQARDPGAEVSPVGLHLGWYEMNKRIRNFDPQGEGRLFGPEEVFSDNCIGDPILEPSERTTCTLRPAPLDPHSDNLLFVDSPSITETVTFRCAGASQRI